MGLGFAGLFSLTGRRCSGDSDGTFASLTLSCFVAPLLLLVEVASWGLLVDGLFDDFLRDFRSRSLLESDSDEEDEDDDDEEDEEEDESRLSLDDDDEERERFFFECFPPDLSLRLVLRESSSLSCPCLRFLASWLSVVVVFVAAAAGGFLRPVEVSLSGGKSCWSSSSSSLL